MRLTGSLRGALERGELYLCYQPQFLASGSVVGFEALLRWDSFELGSVSPQQFIPLAEKSGLIYSIGQWALHEACLFARRLTDQGWDGIRVAVNISSKQLAADNFASIVENVILDAGIEPSQLELEITESVLVASPEDAIQKLTGLKALGVRLSLDDFGTDYSSLTFLRNLPVETLKIDKSFVDMITTDINAAKIIGSIIHMAHVLV
jgi:EAL domain-containing protein (putative c-di-GMP-specific phosphodiesterase class I)